ncbi:MAG: hypothetical protein AAF620_00395 [Bacteroidota bacterium]
MKNYFKNCKTLDEAKKLYYQLAMKLHPDKGGTTEEFQELQGQFESFRAKEEKFKGEQEQWNAKEYSHIIEQLITIPNIVIEVCGSWIWISGDTKPHKEKIKSIETGESYRRGFSKEKLMWYFSPKGYRKKSNHSLSMEEIRVKYGSESFNSKSKKQLQRSKKQLQAA